MGRKKKVVEEKKIIKNVVITGKLQSMKREDFKDVLKRFNVNLQMGIRQDTDYLITNTPDSETIKNRQAEELGIPKISELDFLKLLREQAVEEGEKNE